ncbi:MAG TPA: methenyltetrahydromethanopterin cyclohydrolase [Planctomycetaceae bacterium]|nr:methenyltetrahydromethanopterin cyclohydrolase [Planctomycetaceae bacterium]
MNQQLNARAAHLVDQLLESPELLKVSAHSIAGGGRWIDCGLQAEGGLAAGLTLARICTAGLAEISIIPGEVAGSGWPHLQVSTDHPVAACLLSQYAGWQISVGRFFAMGSGPMRAMAAREELFQKLDYRESASQAIGVLEGRKIPDEGVLQYLAERTGLPASAITLLLAPTASLAGSVQVVARVVETALHKLHEIGFDVKRIRSATGTAPLAPVAKDDLTGIGRTNDAILYGGRVTLYVRGDDQSIAEMGPRVPAMASMAHGRPFLAIFAAAGNDFYKIDPHLFSPAEIVFQNLDTGHVHRFGKVMPEVLRHSFCGE